MIKTITVRTSERDHPRSWSLMAYGKTEDELAMWFESFHAALWSHPLVGVNISVREYGTPG